MKLTTEQENDLIKKYDPLIWKIAWDKGNAGNVEDLHSIGMIAALQAIRWYDEKSNVPIAKTIAWVARKEMYRYMEKTKAQTGNLSFTDKYETTILEDTTADVIDDTYNLKLDMLLTAAQMFDEKDYDIIVLTQKEWLEKYGYKPSSTQSYKIRKKRIINLLKKEFNDEKEY